MAWCTTSDLDVFLAAADGYLRSRAAENTLLLSAAQAARAAGDGHGAGGPASGLLFGWWEPPGGGPPRGAFVHDPVVPLLVAGRIPELAAALAGTLAKLGRPVTGVDAPPEAGDAFAAAWSQRAGTAVRVHRHCGVYRLAIQGPAAPSDGHLRVATPADHALLAGWLTAFAAEAAERIGSPADLAAELIGYGGAVFWQVPQRPARFREADWHLPVPHHRREQPGPAAAPARHPVALAALGRPVAATVRIRLVFTPAEGRRSGYAAALTLAVAQALLGGADGFPGARGLLGGAGAPGRIDEVVLISDGNRPGRWGSRLGYQLVSQRTVLRFGPATGTQRRLRATSPMPRLPGPPRLLPRPRPLP